MIDGVEGWIERRHKLDERKFDKSGCFELLHTHTKALERVFCKGKNVFSLLI